MQSAPWSYSSNLLVLKQCEPDIPEHCYDFSRAAFWVRLVGIPPGWRIEPVYHDLGNKLGQVKDVQLESMGIMQQKGGRVRVEIDLSTPLKAGAILDIGNKWLWVEFIYERLPHYCYSCGKIGHYAQDCLEIPYSESPWAVDKIGSYGPWLQYHLQLGSRI